MNGRGGVHIKSGIADHAFVLAAMKFGGHSWEKAGLIWYATLTGKRILQETSKLLLTQPARAHKNCTERMHRLL